MEKIKYEKQDGKLKIEIKSDIAFEMDVTSRDAEIILTILLSLLKDEKGKKLLIQEEIGKIIGYSRQTTNYTIKDYKEGGFKQALERKEYNSKLFNSDVKSTLKELWLRNPFLKPKELRKKLENIYPHIKGHPITSELLYYHMDEGLSFKQIRQSLVKYFRLKGENELENNSKELIRQMLELLDMRNEESTAFNLLKLKEIFNLEKLQKAIKKRKSKSLNLIKKLKTNLNLMKWSLTFFYFQTNCSMRTVSEYYGTSTAKVVRSISETGMLEEYISRSLGINQKIKTIGIDEKWIKTKGTKNKWSYVFMAVDNASGDLLYTDVFESRNDTTIKLFLYGLRDRGYNPQFIVTDLLPGYTRNIPLVFGKKIKHVHCLIHYLKNLYKHFQEVYGNHFKKDHLKANEFYSQCKKVFLCKSPKTARKRYLEAMQQQKTYPEAEKIFEYMKNHFRHLIYPLEYLDVPRTNNRAEQVIKRFCRQIKNCGGFESIQTARLFFRAFQIVYRLTPFRKDNKNVKIRGKLPVEVSFEKITESYTFCQKTA